MTLKNPKNLTFFGLLRSHFFLSKSIPFFQKISNFSFFLVALLFFMQSEDYWMTEKNIHQLFLKFMVQQINRNTLQILILSMLFYLLMCLLFCTKFKQYLGICMKYMSYESAQHCSKISSWFSVFGIRTKWRNRKSGWNFSFGTNSRNRKSWWIFEQWGEQIRVIYL